MVKSRTKFVVFLVSVMIGLSIVLGMLVSNEMFAFAYDEAVKLTAPRSLDELRKADPNDLAKLEKFDSRDYDIITPIRNQGSKQTCWSYATIAAAEASILREGLTTESNATFHLSEDNIAYTTHNRDGSKDPLGYSAEDNWESNWNQGLNLENSTNMLLQWHGPVKFSGEYQDLHYGTPEFYLENIIKIDKNDRNAMKKAIAQYGGVTISYTTNIYNPYYYNTNHELSHGGQHACTIVGWDDTIPKDNYAIGSYKNPSKYDGGWIVRNSWGPYGEGNGYFYLSYDSTFGSVFAMDFTRTDEYENNYYYDGRVGEGALFLPGKEVAAIFKTKKSTSTKKEYIKAVNVGIEGKNVTAEVRVYTGVSSDPANIGSSLNNPTSGTLRATKTETFKNAGSYTIKLDNLVEIDAGESFSIVVNVTNDTKDASVTFSFEQNSNNDLTFCKEDGKWQNTLVSYDYVARIKVFTVSQDRTEAVNDDLKFATIKLDKSKYRYGEENRSPKVTVMYEGKLLEENVDYTLTCEEVITPPDSIDKENIIVGSGKILVKGKGRYTGENSAFYTILVGLRPTELVFGEYNENTREILMTVDTSAKYYKDIPLPSDWRWVFPENIVNVGENTGNYVEYIGKDSKCYWNIMFPVKLTKTTEALPKIDISTATINIDKFDFIYNGNAITPNISVNLNGKELLKDFDYSVVYSNNINAGQATITIKGKGKYIGENVANFTIEKAKQNTIYEFTIVDGKPVANAEFGEVKYKYFSDKECTLEIPKPTTAGTFWVKAYVDESNNFVGTTSNALSFTINSEEIQIENANADNLLALWISLGVIGGIAIIAVSVYLVKRKRKI